MQHDHGFDNGLTTLFLLSKAIKVIVCVDDKNAADENPKVNLQLISLPFPTLSFIINPISITLRIANRMSHNATCAIAKVNGVTKLLKL